MNPLIPKLRHKLEKALEPMRYEHSLSVSFTCISLAMRYGWDLDQAELAGLLHDCAKQYSNDTIIHKCQKNKVALTEEELAVPNILHAIYGEYMAKETYDIKDPLVLGAIRWHTTGKPDMTMLEKIVYLADYMEPRRNKAPHLTEIRRLAYEDLDLAVFKTMEDTISYLKERSYTVMSVQNDAYEFYKSIVKKEGLLI